MKYIIVFIIGVIGGSLLPIFKPVCASETSYFYIRGGLGYNTILFQYNKEWEGGDQIGGNLGFGYRHKFGKTNWHGTASYDHYSQPWLGKPLNSSNDIEDSLDALYLGGEYHF